MRRARLDIGVHADSMSTTAIDMETELKSDRKRTITLIHETVGSEQVSLKRLDFAPAWIIDEAFQEERKSNWINAYRSVREDEVPYNANVITWHVVYKLKTGKDGRGNSKHE